MRFLHITAVVLIFFFNNCAAVAAEQSPYPPRTVQKLPPLGSADEELRALLRAQTDAIQAIYGRFDDLERRITTLEQANTAVKRSQ